MTIVIPNKDHTEDLDRCVRSLLATKEYTNFEILIIENNSEDQATFDYYEKLKNLSDDVLEAGNLSREEIEDSYKELMNIC